MLSAYLTGAGTGAAESPVSDNVVGAGLPAMRRLVATNA